MSSQSTASARARTAAARAARQRNATMRAVDDPVKLAWAARVITAALERGRLTLNDLTPQGPAR